MRSSPSPLDPAATPAPAGRILSDGCYRVLVTAAGTGESTFGRTALTRWNADRVEDADGFFLYVRDLGDGRFWSAGYRPAGAAAQDYAASWQGGLFTIERLDFGIETRVDLCVAPAVGSRAPTAGTAPACGAEIRRLTLANTSGRPRRIEITSFAELVLHDPAAHAAHPAFSKLFVQTEHEPGSRALLARRRPRARDEAHPWMVHAMLGAPAREHETDRARFLGRGSSLRAPHALCDCQPLSGTTGNVLDPIFSLRTTVHLVPGARTELAMVLGAASDRDLALDLVRGLSGPHAVEDAFRRARADERDRQERCGLDAARAEYWQAVAAAMLYGHPGLRDATRLPGMRRSEVPPRHVFALVHAEHAGAAPHVPELVRAQRYWHALGLPIDLVILYAGEPPFAPVADLPPGEAPRLVRLEDLSGGDRDRLDVAARLVVRDELPDLAALAAGGAASACRASTPGERAAIAAPTPAPAARPNSDNSAGFDLWNGYGGFAAQGTEYVVRLAGDGAALHLPPRPWINVVANERFGFMVSETGACHTWSRNSREHRLTTWSNDPVLDTHGEAFYVRDDEMGDFWSPLPGPAPRGTAYEARHGFGYSAFQHTHADLEEESILFVPHLDPVQIAVLHLRNRGARTRRLSIFAYRRLVLGTLPEHSGRFVVTEIDPVSGALLARNPMAGEFADGFTFATVVTSTPARGLHHTCDRAAFLGRNGSPAAPAALLDPSPLDGRIGPGLDPCIAQQVVLELPAGAEGEVCFLFGEAPTLDELRALLERYTTPGGCRRALQEAREAWQQLLSGIRVATPSPALDLLVNGWMPYQTLSCRIWARSAFYQSSGAFGFRDQLQDAAALVHLSPELTRAQILLHAAHQFVEGDVLHWWHPPRARGLRTRFADDLLWLPYLAAFYVHTTGDRGVLDERVRYLAARALEPGEDEAYLLPVDSGESSDLYEHCCRALDRSLALGPHGLPLFGTGDWNDGMNRVGREGRGESVWMGFFLYTILSDFSSLCTERGDTSRARCYTAHRQKLAAALEEAGWDGEWYRRGYYDDGTPLGSRTSDECRIDGLVQAWAVLSGAAPPARAAQAMRSAERHLISEPEGLIRLLVPAFEDTPQDPGYIKGYVPGVRENGGQYTHAALWVVRALAVLGRNDRVARLLEMLGPVSHTRGPEQVGVYQVEPYVIAADVCGAPPHVGRGGWTWYTGASGWMYRVVLESLLGFQVVNGDCIVLRPCVPDEWPEFTLAWRVPGEETRWEIHVRNPERAARAVVSATCDGEPAAVENGCAHLPLVRDGRLHRAEILLGRGAGGRS